MTFPTPANQGYRTPFHDPSAINCFAGAPYGMKYTMENFDIPRNKSLRNVL
jgi:hypothetical protein